MARHFGRKRPNHRLGFAATPELTIYLIEGHGDSRLGGVYAVTPPTFPAGRAHQFVGPNEVTEGYPLTAGLTDVMVPFGNPVNPQAGGEAVVPMHYAIAELLDSGSDYYIGDNTIIVYSGGGQNGAAVAKSGHALGPLPDGITAYNVAKMADAYAAVQANWPDATIIPHILTVDGTNDNGGVGASTLLTAKLGQLEDLRSADGFATAPIVVVSQCPENAPGLLDTAERVAAMQTEDAIWCQLPTGVGLVHEGEVSGQDVLIGIEDSGRNNYARSLAISLGALVPSSAVISTPTSIDVDEGSADAITFQADKKVYGTVAAGYESIIELSGDVELDQQEIRPVGGTWPAFTGTSADAIPFAINWKDADGKTGTFNATINVAEAAPAPIPYVFFDSGDRANAAISSAGSGVSSGKDGYGGGIAWVGNGGINSNKLTVSPFETADVGRTYARWGARVTVSGTNWGPLFCAGVAANGHYLAGLYLNSSGQASLYEYTLGTRPITSAVTGLAPGTYDIEIRSFSNGNVEAYVDGVLFLSGPTFWGPQSSDYTRIGIGNDVYGTGIYFDDVWVLDHA